MKWYNCEKGVGFIAPEDGSTDVFVHYTEIQGSGFRTLEENQRVEFEVGQGTQATDAVRVLQTRGGGDGGDTRSLVVPISTAAYQTPNAGVAVKWNTAEALALFTTIKNDEPMTVAPAGTAPGH